jgi:hypothetical protein
MVSPRPRFAFALLASLLASCGGGGSDLSPGGAPSDLSYTSPPTYMVGQAITPLTPTVIGQVTTYSITPSLPAGLALSATSGSISGTPTAAAAETSYTVTASNSYGRTTAMVSIVVDATPPSAVTYGSAYYAYTANVPSQPIVPSTTGGAASGWSIKPALPAGLTFSTENGTVSGTPTAASSATLYTVSAMNSGGQATTTFTLAVTAAPLLEIGHSTTIELIRFNGSSLMSLDNSGHWTLENYSTGTYLARGDGACVNCNMPFGGFHSPPVDVAGSTAIDAMPNGVEIRSTSDGSLSATLTGSFSWFQLASDGSYVAAGTSIGVTVWSPAGAVLFTRSGDYSKALAFAAPGQLQVAEGPAGQNVIETLSVPAGTSTVSPPFQGTFAAWFQDGARFLTNTGTTVWTYSAAAVQADITTVANPTGLGGEGNFFWAGTIAVYQVGNSAAPAYSGNFDSDTIVPAGTSIGIVGQGTRQVTVIDLSGAAPVASSYTLPVDDPVAYGASSAATWLAGTLEGVVVDGASLASQPRYLALGAVTGVAAGTAYFSIATASGQIFYYNAVTNAQLGSIDFPSRTLATSADGSVLAAASYLSDNPSPQPNATVNVYSMPAGSVLNTFSFAAPEDVSITVSASGTALSEIPGSTSGCKSEVVSTSTAAEIWCSPTVSFYKLALSPDATLIAASGTDSTGAGADIPTNIYNNGSLVTTVTGFAVGWLDNTRFLANEYVLQDMQTAPTYTQAQIFSSTGAVLAPAPVPLLGTLQPVTTNSVYSPQVNEIVSVSTGAATWASANPIAIPRYSTVDVGYPQSAGGGITGTAVIFASGGFVLEQSY